MSTANQREAVLAALESQVEEIRHQAVRRLSEIFSEVPPALIVKALGDPSWRVRKAAVALALHAPDHGLVQALVVAIGDHDNAGLRNASTEVLIQIGRTAIPVVVEMMQRGDQDQRKFAADILGEIHHADAFDALLRGLRDEDENVRGASAEALGHIGDPRAGEVLIEALREDSLLVQLSCLDALERLDVRVPLGVLRPLWSSRPLRPCLYRLLACSRDAALDEQATALLLDGLSSRSRAERSAAAQALVSLSRQLDRQAQVDIRVQVARAADDAFCARLSELLESSEIRDREAAVVLLGWTGREDVVGDLIQAAAEEQLRALVQDALLAIGPKAAQTIGERVADLGRAERVLALELLGHFRHAPAVEFVLEMCLSEDSDVADAAQRALSELADPTILPELVALIARGAEPAVTGAVASLCKLGERFHDEVVSAVLPLCSSLRPVARTAAAEVLTEIAKLQDQRLLEQLAGDEDPHIRATAIRALGRVGGELVLARVRMMLADESPEVRAAAAQALGSRADDESRNALRVALADQDPAVVSAALQSLGQSGASEIASAIVPFVHHEDGGVAIEAVRTLCRLIEGPEVALIRKAVSGADPEVLREVLSVVDRWPRDQALLILQDALENERWDLRVTAVRKLSELRDPEGLRLLVTRVPVETDPLVQEAMERALSAGLK